MLKRFKKLFKKKQRDGGAQRGEDESEDDEPREGECQTVTGYEYQWLLYNSYYSNLYPVLTSNL